MSGGEAAQPAALSSALPANLNEGLRRLFSVSCGTPVARIVSWLRKEALRPNTGLIFSRSCSDSLRRGCADREADFLPMHLPVRPACLFGGARLASRRRLQRARVRQLAWIFAECQAGVFDYLELDLPTSPSQYRRGLGSHKVTPAQLAAFDNLVAANLRFCRRDPGFLGLGRGMLRRASTAPLRPNRLARQCPSARLAFSCPSVLACATPRLSFRAL